MCVLEGLNCTLAAHMPALSVIIIAVLHQNEAFKAHSEHINGFIKSLSSTGLNSRLFVSAPWVQPSALVLVPPAFSSESFAVVTTCFLIWVGMGVGGVGVVDAGR